MGQVGVSLDFENPEKGVGANDGFQFGVFFGGQLAFPAFARQFVITGLGFIVGLNAHKRAREFDREIGG